MKTTGIVLSVIGGLSTLGSIMWAVEGKQTNFSGVALLVLGLFLISRANKNKEEEENKRKWENEKSN